VDESDVDTVLLVCDNEEDSRHILGRLAAQGISVVGPATSVAQARTLAAQTFAHIAVLAPRPSEGPLGRDLAQDLMRTWGVRSLILDTAEAQGEWALPPGQVARLRSVLGPEPRLA
jgi:hypothetical protein